jgi:hypothetical protein
LAEPGRRDDAEQAKVNAGLPHFSAALLYPGKQTFPAFAAGKQSAGSKMPSRFALRPRAGAPVDKRPVFRVPPNRQSSTLARREAPTAFVGRAIAASGPCGPIQTMS